MRLMERLGLKIISTTDSRMLSYERVFKSSTLRPGRTLSTPSATGLGPLPRPTTPSVITSRSHIGTVNESRTQWLFELAPTQFDPKTFPDGETKRALMRVGRKKWARAGSA
ncbi:hypothetical protein CALCODRAFT_480605 [Calocera cornea HHB12733]|uniref:Uncharacterized protein n=1 Tax=Calocera cornea HHB12733 TaxID=1353952 RepID=A0A165IFM1_9BASI|nr:hypothetical protein CALCODRAFT_480605 [Calocera cornea HHB12733]